MSQAIVFTCKEQRIGPDGSIETLEEKTFGVKRPDAKQQGEGQKVYNRAFNAAISSGCILRAKLEDFMREQGLWSDSKQEKFIRLNKDVGALERKLAAGGIEFSEAIDIAKKMRRLRSELRELISDRTELDTNTAEGQAENARFNYYVSVCLVYNDTRQPVFKDLDAYLNQAGTEQAIMGATKLAQMLYGLSDDFESKFPEVQFFRDFGLMDEKNRFINEEGKFVDIDGKLINEDGHFVLPDGTLCDVDGNPMNADGTYIVEKKPFLRDGKPVEPKKKNEVVKTD